MAGILRQAGATVVDDPEAADVAIVNTCGFIREAKEESIEAILATAHLKSPAGLRHLIIAGCLSQRYSAELFDEIPEGDGFLGTDQIHRIVEMVSAVRHGQRPVWMSREAAVSGVGAPRRLSTPPSYAYLKIAEGCDNHCRYCAIPHIRGPFRSVEQPRLLDEARALAALGVPEVILIAQDITRYGQEWSDGTGLAGFLRLLRDDALFAWIRLLYIHPARLTAELAGIIAERGGVVPYIDVPFQHSHPVILAAMGRPVDTTPAEDQIAALRAACPEAGVRTTVLVGFPGETPRHVDHLLEFIERVRFDHLGVFPYSPEEGTPVYHRRGPSRAEKQRRVELVMERQAEISREALLKRVGQWTDVLIDGAAEDQPLALAGHAPFQCPEIDGQVILTDGCAGLPGSIVRVKLTGSTTYDLIGEPLLAPPQVED